MPRRLTSSALPAAPRSSRRSTNPWSPPTRNWLRNWVDGETRSALLAKDDGKLIADIGQNIFNIIDQASSPLRERLADIPKAEKEKRDAAWMVMNLQAFTGLAEQVGNRLADLAAGNKIPDVTRANEAVDLLNRSSADKFIEQLTKDTLHAEKVEVALQIYTPEKLSGLWDRQADIFKIDHKAPKAQRDALAKELKSIDAQYRTLKEQIKEIQTSAASKGELDNALDRVDNLRRELNRKGLSDAERADLIDRRDKATEALIEKVSEISRESAEANGKRLEDYQQMLTESTSHYESDRKQFWDSTWKVLSTTIDAANQKQLRKSLETAFGSELPDQLKSWNKELGADKPRADKLQEYGTAVVSAIDSYLHKAELILGTTPAFGEISDGLKAALKASGFPCRRNSPSSSRAADSVSRIEGQTPKGSDYGYCSSVFDKWGNIAAGSYHRTEVTGTDGILRSVRIESSLPVVLTSDWSYTGPQTVLLVGDLAHDLEVYGDEVAIRGMIKAPGRSVTICARVLNGITCGQPKMPPSANILGMIRQPGETDVTFMTRWGTIARQLTGPPPRSSPPWA